MKKNTFLKIIIFIQLIATICLSQSDLEKNLSKILNPSNNYIDDYVRDYVKGYMQPFVTAFGASVSGGMYHRATVKDFPRFDAGVSAVFIKIPNTGLQFTDLQNHTVPTVFGETKLPGHDNDLPGGTGQGSLLIPQLQINLGLISNFEVTGRYLTYDFNELGQITLMGLGVKYGFGEFVPVFPIDLSVQAMYHKFAIGDWLNSGTIGMNLQLSKDIPAFPIDLYGGIGFENTSMVIKTATLPLEDIKNIGDINITGENNFRLNFGISWTMTFFNLHADYNFGKYNSMSFGAMIVL